MENFEEKADEIIFEMSAERKYNRILDLLASEKKLIKAQSLLDSWEIFRNGISEQYPELLKWCPGYSPATDPHEAGNYEPLDFLLLDNQPLEIMDGETFSEFEARMKTVTIHDPELPGVVIVDSVNV